ncbi:outer membrane beta-barrel protein [Bacteriovorax sp. Seq25_V]|uniref:outer membrane beta-barrel protein n=1 Tax=Bacteriovorax sp. Seq25_V TaxID=1201288 RepID=UPI00038A1FF7|nr:outer membrane beta-barrel protein [Bacteriovorax sp. Seq25_V]EQC47118.1 outer membrane protein beta-barrel domain protein [Bacteriovorax sp. Seq25_V]
MKKVLIPALVLLNLATFAQTNTTETNTVGLANSEKTLDLNISLNTNSMKIDGENIDGNAIEASFGKEFILSDTLVTKTSLNLGLNSLDKNIDGSKLDVNRMTETGLSQNLIYVTEINGTIVKPFLGAGVAIGQWNIEVKDQDEEILTAELETDYTKLSLNAGVEILLDSGIKGIVKVSQSKIKFDNTSDVSISGTEFNGTASFDNELSDTNSTSISLGVGYQF